MHSVQRFVFAQAPQQSPPSKLHSKVLVSSLQKPFPISLNVASQWQMHPTHFSVLTSVPQQSPPSK